MSCDPSGSTSERPSDTGDCITTTDITSGVDTADSPEEMCSVFDEDTKDSSIIATVSYTLLTLSFSLKLPEAYLLNSFGLK